MTTMSSAARMPRWSSTPEYASVPVRSMVCTGLMRPIAGYMLFAPWGPLLSKLRAREITFPFFTRRAAATMSSGRVWFSVPISSLGPHLPQFLYFSAASRRSCLLSLRPGMGLPLRVVQAFLGNLRAATLAQAAAPGRARGTRRDDKMDGPSQEALMGTVVRVFAFWLAWVLAGASPAQE